MYEADAGVLHQDLEAAVVLLLVHQHFQHQVDVLGRDAAGVLPEGRLHGVAGEVHILVLIVDLGYLLGQLQPVLQCE